MTKLFKKKDASELRSVRRAILWTEKEYAEVELAASIRQLDASDFVRRAALGRKADIRFEVDTVLALSDLTRAIREIHAAYVAGGATPPEDEWCLIRKAAIAAMLRIGK